MSNGATSYASLSSLSLPQCFQCASVCQLPDDHPPERPQSRYTVSFQDSHRSARWEGSHSISHLGVRGHVFHGRKSRPLSCIDHFSTSVGRTWRPRWLYWPTHERL